MVGDFSQGDRRSSEEEPGLVSKSSYAQPGKPHFRSAAGKPAKLKPAETHFEWLNANTPSPPALAYIPIVTSYSISCTSFVGMATFRIIMPSPRGGGEREPFVLCLALPPTRLAGQETLSPPSGDQAPAADRSCRAKVPQLDVSNTVCFQMFPDPFGAHSEFLNSGNCTGH